MSWNGTSSWDEVLSERVKIVVKEVEELD